MTVMGSATGDRHLFRIQNRSPPADRMSVVHAQAGFAVLGMTFRGELGRGARSVVYLGVRDGHEYAVKVLLELGGPDEATAFCREAATLACLVHPALPSIHEVGEVDGRPYLIMDRSAGSPLTGEHSEADLAAIGAEVAGALAVAHRAGVVHRDVKPDNILVDPGGHVHLIDFGLAGHAGSVAGETAAGTLHYSAPEQTGVLHRAVDGRSDLYALGVVLYECLAGRLPFTAADAGELIRMHLSSRPPELPAYVSSAFAAVIGRLLAKDPDDRYESAEGLRQDLLTIARGESDRFRPGAQDGAVRTDPDLVGRHEQLACLVGRWRRARGGVVLVEGAPGNGKSRLVREFTSLVSAEGTLVLHGKASADDVPLAVLRRLIDQHVTSIRRLGPEEHHDVAVERLRAAAGTTAPMLQALSPALAALLGLDNGGQDADENQFGDAVAAFLARLGPAVLHLDDVQWCDQATLQVLGKLAPRLRESGLLLTATARDDHASAAAVTAFADLTGSALDTRLTVPPLDRTAIRALLADRLGAGVVPAELIDRLAARSGGNPLAAHEYVRSVIDAGLLTPHWGRWRLDTAGLDALALPEDVIELILRRVDSLGCNAREVLVVAAVCGTRFQVPVVAAASSTHPAEVAEAFAEATALRLVETGRDGVLVFLHDRIREALLAGRDVRWVHQRVADALTAASPPDARTSQDAYAIAHHYLAGNVDRTPGKVYVAAIVAGERALAEHLPTEAFNYLSTALDLAGPAKTTPSATLYVALGTAAALTGRYATSDEHFITALRIERDPLRRARIYSRLAQSRHERWQAVESIEMARRGLAEIGSEPPRSAPGLAIAALSALARGVLIGWLPERITLAAGRRDVLAVRCNLLAAAAHGYGFIFEQPRMLAYILLGLPHARRLGRQAEYAVVQSGLAVAARLSGAHRWADRLLSRAAQAAGETKDPLVIAHLQWVHGIANDIAPPMHRTSGQLARRIAETFGPAMSMGERLTTYIQVGPIAILRGHTDEAAAIHRRGTELADNAHDHMGGMFLTLQAQTCALSGDHALAAASLRDARAHAERFAQNLPQLLSCLIAAIHLAVESGETGSDLDRVIDEFMELPINTRGLWNFQQSVWVWIAFGRLAQLSAASDADLPNRTRQAREAVRALRSRARGPVLRAFHELVRASLEQLTGDHRRAIERTARLITQSGGLDLPLLRFEIARVRARAWRDLGCPAEAQQEASTALSLAVADGWRTRMDWIRSEFGLSPAEPSIGPPSAGGSSTSGLQDNRRLAALQQVSLASATVLQPDVLARVALDEINRIFSAERAFLFLVEEDGLKPFVGRDHTGADVIQLTEYGSTLVDRVRRERAALVVTGDEQGEALGSRSMMMHGLRSIMVAPLQHRGRLLGVVYLDSRTARGIFTTDDVDLLVAITSQVAAALETTRVAQLELAVHVAESERDLADSLREGLTALTASLDPDNVREVLAARLRAALPDAEVTVLPAGSGMDSEFLSGSMDDAPAPVRRLLDARATAWLAASMTIRDEDHGFVVAVRHTGSFSDTELRVTAALAGQGAAALDNALLFRRIQELAARDGLTELFNRRHFHQLGDRQVRDDVHEGRAVAALMLDIDNFKNVNDTYGHSIGDEVIRAVADRITSVLRDADLISRYGGEEFAVILAETSEAGVSSAAERIRQTVATTPISTAAGPLHVTVSIGAARSTELSLSGLLESADEALYSAKRNGRNRVEMAKL
ncbi:diguanylate cyclase [Paractinoplanes hotanensis]|uniref:Diguanylate cyclase n=1 Tax=Paractinoplanes hotanensis TaxID=2906497 RepID=A0ABT0YBN5_9ACTN|nr:diguanylate cyclase [Actinoplanes hotanensis]MCM4083456.1 diguanylate cyclase [Actinoplanes hotanensis]